MKGLYLRVCSLRDGRLWPSLLEAVDCRTFIAVALLLNLWADEPQETWADSHVFHSHLILFSTVTLTDWTLAWRQADGGEDWKTTTWRDSGCEFTLMVWRACLCRDISACLALQTVSTEGQDFFNGLKAGIAAHIEPVEVLSLAAIWRILTVRNHFVVSDAKRRQMGHVEVSVDLFEASVLVAEVAPFAIWAEPLPIELPAVLRLVLVVRTACFLLLQIKLMILTELLQSVGILTFLAVATETRLCPVLAELTLVHWALYKALLLEVEHQINIHLHGWRTLLLAGSSWSFDRWQRDRCHWNWHESLWLHTHSPEWIAGLHWWELLRLCLHEMRLSWSCRDRLEGRTVDRDGCRSTWAVISSHVVSNCRSIALPQICYLLLWHEVLLAHSLLFRVVESLHLVWILNSVIWGGWVLEGHCLEFLELLSSPCCWVKGLSRLLVKWVLLRSAGLEGRSTDLHGCVSEDGDWNWNKF